LAFLISLGNKSEEQLKRMEEEVAINMNTVSAPSKIAKL